MPAHPVTARPTAAPDAARPRYIEIQDDLQRRILGGSWPPGHRLPSEHELLAQYDCSRMTVNKALSALASAGLIVRRRRAGSFVAAPTSQGTVLKIHDIREEVSEAGKSYRYEVIGRTVRKATAEDMRRLELESRVEVLAVEVRHDSGERPYVFEERLINLAEVPDARDEAFASSPPGTWLLQQIPWTDAEHVIRAAPADATAARRLGIGNGEACLVIERRTWQAGRPLTAVRLVYPGDRHQLVARFNPGMPAKGM